jgi:translation initiation factor 3 subunit H
MTNVYTAAPDSLEEIQTQKRVGEVHIDGLALLKITKHCDENSSRIVYGSLLGLDVDGILEVTYSYPIPDPKSEHSDPSEDSANEFDGQDYQIEMMKMLRDVNMDNNCVGWYQSMYAGTYSTDEIVGLQFSHQASEDLSDNSVVLLYDPEQTKRGQLAVRAFRLSDEYMALRKSKENDFIKPSNILIELPVRIKNGGHIAGLIRCLQDSHADVINCEFDALSLAGSDSLIEKHLECMGNTADDLIEEQRKFQQYAKISAKPRQERIRWLNNRVQENVERAENGEDLLSTSLHELKPLPDAPPRVEPVLMLGQLDVYSKKLNEHVDLTLEKAFATSQLFSSK